MEGSYGEGFENLSEEHQNIIKQFEETHNKVLELSGDLDAWSKTSDKNGMQIYTQQSDRGNRIVRAEGHFNFPAHLVAEYALDTQIRSEIDKLFKEARVVQEVGCGLGYEYARMKGTFIFSDRDFVTVRHRKEEDSGRIVISCYSVEHPDCPEVSGCVRGALGIFGYVLTPDADDSDKCFAQLISEGNLKGNIPKALANQAVVANGKFMHKLNKRLIADS